MRGSLTSHRSDGTSACSTPVDLVNDLLIAAIPRVNDLAVATRNTRAFARVGGLRVEDWESGPG
jgi:predicted nucleic acid-binding protein